MGPAAASGAVEVKSEEDVSIIDINVKRSVDNTFVCPKACGKRFTKLSSLKMHYKKIHSPSPPPPDGQKPFKCNIEKCSAAYASRDNLKRHFKGVHNTISEEFRCTFAGCFASYDKKSNLRRHFAAAHKGVVFDQMENKLPCSICGEILLNDFELTSHIALMHGFKCENCDKICPTEQQLRRHMTYHRGIEKREKKFECEKCKVTLSSYNDLTLHRKTEEHRAKMLAGYKCEICGFQCSTKGNIDRHKRTHEELRNNFHCPNDGCDRYYFHEKNLRVHLESCSFSELKARHLCDLCGSILSTKQKLLNHQAKMHDPNKRVEVEESKPRLKRRRKTLVEKVIASFSRPRSPPSQKPTKRRRTATVKPATVKLPLSLEHKTELRTKIREKEHPVPRPSYAKRSRFTQYRMTLLASKQKIAKMEEFRDATSDTNIPLKSSSSSSNSGSVTLPDYSIPDQFLNSVQNKDSPPLVQEEVLKQTTEGIVIDLMHIC